MRIVESSLQEHQHDRASDMEAAILVVADVDERLDYFCVSLKERKVTIVTTTHLNLTRPPP